MRPPTLCPTTMANFLPMPTPAPAPINLALLDDEALMTAYAAHDERAFAALYERHSAGLYRFVRRLLGPRHTALVDEVYQDTWLRVVHARAQWMPHGATFRTWLFTLAHHRVVDVLRRTGREVALDDRNDAAPYEPDAEPWQQWPAAASAAPSSDDALFWRRAGARLLACLAELPMAQRAVFLLHHDDGESLDAIASALDLGFETARSRLRYAMAKLRTCMGAYLDPLQSLGDKP
jgi:RNA polymerase sigma factor (sigma-70 family)